MFDIRALLKTPESESARRLFGLKNFEKPQNTTVFLRFSEFFRLKNPQAFPNSRFLEAPIIGGSFETSSFMLFALPVHGIFLGNAPIHKVLAVFSENALRRNRLRIILESISK